MIVYQELSGNIGLQLKFRKPTVFNPFEMGMVSTGNAVLLLISICSWPQPETWHWVRHMHVQIGLWGTCNSEEFKYWWWCSGGSLWLIVFWIFFPETLITWSIAHNTYKLIKWTHAPAHSKVFTVKRAFCLRALLKYKTSTKKMQMSKITFKKNFMTEFPRPTSVAGICVF